MELKIDSASLSFDSFGLVFILSLHPPSCMQVAVGRAYKLRAAAAAARGLDFNYPDRNLGIKGTAPPRGVRSRSRMSTHRYWSTH